MDKVEKIASIVLPNQLFENVKNNPADQCHYSDSLNVF